ncbi:hypothetical protein AAG570_003221 [Ranatra chinensis]|uniref:Uncharacterized protein n=1 Tax=Ranatra chinensis TaxID=642074 RepID=A0ABD0Y667_9HEMI
MTESCQQRLEESQASWMDRDQRTVKVPPRTSQTCMPPPDPVKRRTPVLGNNGAKHLTARSTRLATCRFQGGKIRYTSGSSTHSGIVKWDRMAGRGPCYPPFSERTCVKTCLRAKSESVLGGLRESSLGCLLLVLDPLPAPVALICKQFQWELLAVWIVLVLFVPSSVMSAPARSGQGGQEEQPFWTNPCGSTPSDGDNHTPSQRPVSSILDSIRIAAWRATMQTDFKERYRAELVMTRRPFAGDKSVPVPSEKLPCEPTPRLRVWDGGWERWHLLFPTRLIFNSMDEHRPLPRDDFLPASFVTRSPGEATGDVNAGTGTESLGL